MRLRLFLCTVALAFLPALAVAQGHLLVVGGGNSPSGSYAWFVSRAPGQTVVVADYTNDPGLSIVDDLEDAGATVVYLPVASETDANDPANAETILSAGAVFLPGGDQAEYVTKWQGSLVADAIRTVYEDGGIVGGTSAGAMVLSEVVFDARHGSFSSRRGLLTPMHPAISLTDDFLGLLPNTFVDSHFYERGRLGRLLAVLVNYHAETGRWVYGLGIDDGTAIAVDPDGTAEVMGTGAVAFVRPEDGATGTTVDGAPLALSPVAFSQFTHGFRFDVTTGALVEAPADAEAFEPVPLAFDASRHWLDGSAAAASWLADGGGIARLDGHLAAGDRVAVLSAPGDPAAETVVTALSADRPTDWIELDPNQPDDAEDVAALTAADAFVLVGTDLETAGALLQPDTGVGAAFHGRIDAGASAAWAGPTAKLLTDAIVLNTESRRDASFLGLLETAPGAGRAEGLVVIPLAWDVDDRYWENHTAGLFWGMARAGASLGLLLPEGTVLDFDGPLTTPEGTTPVIAVDARDNPTVGYPALRHNAALVDATIRVIPPAETVDFSQPTTDGESIPSASVLRPALYPNPSHQTVTLRLDAADAGDVTVTANDLLGREVFTRAWHAQTAGMHDLTWTWPSSLPTGTYILRVRTAEHTFSLRATRVR